MSKNLTKSALQKRNKIKQKLIKQGLSVKDEFLENGATYFIIANGGQKCQVSKSYLEAQPALTALNQFEILQPRNETFALLETRCTSGQRISILEATLKHENGSCNENKPNVTFIGKFSYSKKYHILIS